jgi:hypothetical protein
MFASGNRGSTGRRLLSDCSRGAPVLRGGEPVVHCGIFDEYCVLALSDAAIGR